MWMEGPKHLHWIFLAHSAMKCGQSFGGSESALRLLLAFVLESKLPVSSRFFWKACLVLILVLVHIWMSFSP